MFAVCLYCYKLIIRLLAATLVRKTYLESRNLSFIRKLLIINRQLVSY